MAERRARTRIRICFPVRDSSRDAAAVTGCKTERLSTCCEFESGCGNGAKVRLTSGFQRPTRLGLRFHRCYLGAACVSTVALLRQFGLWEKGLLSGTTGCFHPSRFACARTQLVSAQVEKLRLCASRLELEEPGMSLQTPDSSFHAAFNVHLFGCSCSSSRPGAFETAFHAFPAEFSREDLSKELAFDSPEIRVYFRNSFLIRSSEHASRRQSVSQVKTNLQLFLCASPARNAAARPPGDSFSPGRGGLEPCSWGCLLPVHGLLCLGCCC